MGRDYTAGYICLTLEQPYPGINVSGCVQVEGKQVKIHGIHIILSYLQEKRRGLQDFFSRTIRSDVANPSVFTFLIRYYIG